MGPAGTPRTVVTPCASQSLWMYSGRGLWGRRRCGRAGRRSRAGRTCPCLDLLVPLAGRPWSRMGTPGEPTLRISAMRLFSTTMSTGPRGGAPVPSIMVMPRITMRLNGPSPSPAGRLGEPLILMSWAERDTAANARRRHVVVRNIFGLGRSIAKSWGRAERGPRINTEERGFENWPVPIGPVGASLLNGGGGVRRVVGRAEKGPRINTDERGFENWPVPIGPVGASLLNGGGGVRRLVGRAEKGPRINTDERGFENWPVPIGPVGASLLNGGGGVRQLVGRAEMGPRTNTEECGFENWPVPIGPVGASLLNGGGGVRRLVGGEMGPRKRGMGFENWPVPIGPVGASLLNGGGGVRRLVGRAEMGPRINTEERGFENWPVPIGPVGASLLNGGGGVRRLVGRGEMGPRINTDERGFGIGRVGGFLSGVKLVW